MLSRIAHTFRRRAIAASLAALAGIAAAPVAAQMTEIDPNAGIDADLEPGWQQPSQQQQLPPIDEGLPYRVDNDQSGPDNRYDSVEQSWEDYPAEQAQATPAQQDSGIATQTVNPADTYKEDDLIGAAEGLFGKGAEGLARVI